MRQCSNLKYAQRAGSDVTLRCSIKGIDGVQRRGSVDVRILHITDNVLTAKLVLFGAAARMPYRAGNTIVVGPVYYSDQYQNFVLQRGGTIHMV